MPLPGRKLHVSQPQPVIDSPAAGPFCAGRSSRCRRPRRRPDVSAAAGRQRPGGRDGPDPGTVCAETGACCAGSPAWSPTCWSPRTPTPTSFGPAPGADERVREIQWSLLPPLSMCVPQVEVAGMLEPAYSVAGDSFDYALNDDILHVALIDAMGQASTRHDGDRGHRAYRHARRVFIGLADKYAFMDDAISRQFGPGHFVTAQLMQMNIATVRWLVNAGHPAPLLIRDGPGGAATGERDDSARRLWRRGTADQRAHAPGRRPRAVLHRRHHRGARRRRGAVRRGTPHPLHQPPGDGAVRGVRADLRRLSHMLKRERGGHTSDDATLFMIEWRGGAADHLAVLD